MKKLLLVVSIISAIVCVLSLAFAAWNLYGYYHVLDGTADLFNRLQGRMNFCFIIGIAFAGIGIVCVIIRRKI